MTKFKEQINTRWDRAWCCVVDMIWLGEAVPPCLVGGNGGEARYSQACSGFSCTLACLRIPWRVKYQVGYLRRSSLSGMVRVTRAHN